MDTIFYFNYSVLKPSSFSILKLPLALLQEILVENIGVEPMTFPTLSVGTLKFFQLFLFNT